MQRHSGRSLWSAAQKGIEMGYEWIFEPVLA